MVKQMDIDLAMKTVEFIEVLKPRIVTIENVWGYRKFQSFRGGARCEGILPALERMGYWVDVQHCNSADFGAPQTRRRLILRAVRGAWVPDAAGGGAVDRLVRGDRGLDPDTAGEPFCALAVGKVAGRNANDDLFSGLRLPKH